MVFFLFYFVKLKYSMSFCMNVHRICVSMHEFYASGSVNGFMCLYLLYTSVCTCTCHIRNAPTFMCVSMCGYPCMYCQLITSVAEASEQQVDSGVMF